MLDRLVHRVLLGWPARFAPGENVHHRALAAMAAGRLAEAEGLFERAAERYRRELRVEALARLRVHQMMARARALADPAREAEAMLEIVRALNRLDRLESTSGPFELCDAREVLARWLAERPGDAARGAMTVEAREPLAA
ncbi:MAG TPA: hypothetical protein VMH61_00765 [Candidatus Acidoferrales bacterium]|nr:hypothetical protein [Candidatus Acidoferrales bacterium]